MYGSLLLLPILIRYTVATCNQLLVHNGAFTEYQISEGVFKTLDTVGLRACQMACVRRTRCQSIGFNRNTLTCYLGSNTDRKVHTANRDDIYIEHNWNKTLSDSLGPCRSRQCSKSELCVPLWNGNYSCISESVSVDLTVLFQVSDDITTEEFQSMVNCTQRLLAYLYDVRLAAVCFSGTTAIKFNLNEYDTVSAQIQALQDLSCGGNGKRQLKNAIMNIHEQVYNGSIGDRPEAKNVFFVMLKADNISTNKLMEEAAAVRAADIQIVAAGVTSSSVGHEILDMVVSEPLDENKLTVSSLGELIGTEKRIARAINLGHE